MSDKRIRRFYKTVGVGECESEFVLLLDGNPAKTPRGAALRVPARGLADAMAEEWRGQGEQLDPRSMMLTHLAYSAIDRVGRERGKAVEHAMQIGRADLLCYRAETSEALAGRQSKIWDPLLAWAHDECGLRLAADSGITYVEQPADALLRIQELTAGLDDFALAGFDAAATSTGSFVLALALVKGRLSAERAFEAAMLEELWQVETWGRDAEAEARRQRLREELTAIEQFLRLLET